RAEVFERELWRIAVEHLDYGEQHVWAALAGARVAPNGWRRAKAMLHFDRGGELKRRFLLTAVQRNRNSQLRLRALQEIAHARDARRLVHAARKEDRRLSAALLAAALAHTPEAEEALRGARTRMARKPAALARELLRNFPKGRRGKTRRRRKSGGSGGRTQ